jgi:SHS2 domain-containing protein
MGGYRFIEHTADAGLEVWAEDLSELFRQSTLGMLAIIFVPEKVQIREKKEVAVSGIDIEDLLVRWLSEIKYIAQCERFLPRDVAIKEVSPGRVSGLIMGERFDPEKHEYLIELKNVTYHGLKIKRGEDNNYSVRIIFDL